MNLYRLLLFTLLPIALSSCRKTEERPLVIVDSQLVTRESVAGAASFENAIVKYLVSVPLVHNSIESGQWAAYNILAERVTASDGNRIVDVTLREGVRFHDGRALTARDIPPRVEEVKEANRERPDEIYRGLTVEVLDRRRFRIKSTLPIPDIDSLLSNIYVDYIDGSGSLVGAGPYRFSRWIEGGVELAANEDYFEAPPRIKKIVYLHEADERKRLYMLLKGEADLMVLLSPETARFLEKDGRFRIGRLPWIDPQALFFNTRSPLFSDKRVRKALSLAIDRRTLVEEGLKGAGDVASSLSIEENRNYRPEEALRLLKEAGWRYSADEKRLEKNGERLKFTLYYLSEYEIEWKVPGLLAQQFYEIGVETRLVPIHSALMTKLSSTTSGENSAFLSTACTGDRCLFGNWHSHGDLNYSQFSSREADNLIERLQESPGVEEASAMHTRFGQILDEETPAAFLYNHVYFTAANRRFEGADAFVANVYQVYRIKDWSLR